MSSLEFKNEFTKYLSNILKAFLGCPCNNGCKDHVKKIASNGYLDFQDDRGSTIFHLAAAYNNNENINVYNSLLELLNTQGKKHLLLNKNQDGETPIEIAFLHDNKNFILSAKTRVIVEFCVWT